MLKPLHSVSNGSATAPPRSTTLRAHLDHYIGPRTAPTLTRCLSKTSAVNGGTQHKVRERTILTYQCLRVFHDIVVQVLETFDDILKIK